MLYGLGDDEFHEHLAAERQHHDEERKRAAGIARRDGSISTLLPAVLDDYVGEDNPVRAIDVFVDGLDLAKLGFDDVAPLATGRPAYHPAPLLKVPPNGSVISRSKIARFSLVSRRLPRMTSSMPVATNHAAFAFSWSCLRQVLSRIRGRSALAAIRDALPATAPEPTAAGSSG
jgi:hypothetical protein